MDWVLGAKLVKEVGLSIGVFILCAWMVKMIVTRLGTKIDKMVASQEVFMKRVRDEHNQCSEQHKVMMEDHKETARQHGEMIQCLGRINGYRRGDN